MKLPYAPVEFTSKGAVAKQGQVDAALKLITSCGATDVLVVVHGWNNDMTAAQRLYERLTDNLVPLVRAGAKVAVIGVLWPSIRWADDDEVAGGGVSVGAAPGADEAALTAAITASVDDSAVRARLLELTGELGTAAGRESFLDALRDALPAPAAGPDEEPAPAALRTGDTEQVFETVRVAVLGSDDDTVAAPVGTGTGAPGVAADLLAEEGAGEPGTVGAGLFGLSWPKLATQVLNTATYYTMKARAGDVGANGVAPLVDRINAANPGIRVHLVGHSFGGRAVAAAATNITTPVASLTLLQAAFSHFGFTHDYGGSRKDGAFRGAVANGRIHGPVVITHTHNDTAVGKAYAIASRLAGQSGASIGGPDDPYGGIGANGSLGTSAAELVLGDTAARYTLTAGRVHNLKADAHVTNHGDVTNPAVANALAAAMGLR